MDNSKKIAELEKQLETLKKEQAEFDSLSEANRLAEIIHKKTCRSNHTDACGWEYESWSKIGATRLSYVKKAEAILKSVDYQLAVFIIENI